MAVRFAALAIGIGIAAGAATAATPKVTLTIAVSGNGTVVSAPRGISCPGRCRAKFAKGAALTLRATPAAGSKFSRWTGACTGTTPRCRLKMKTSKRAGAVFETVGFTPQTLAGNWQGSWNDTRFGTSGSLSATVTVNDPTSFTFTLNLGGAIFGCGPQPPVGLMLTEGAGVNHWNANGFMIQITGPAGGTIAVTYDFATQRLTGSGRPGCRPSVMWALDGTFSGNTFSGQMTTTLEDGSTAPAVITLTRS